jgi:hypothetical protein
MSCSSWNGITRSARRSAAVSGVGDHAVKVRVGCLWVRLRHLGLTLKKSRNAQQSRTAPT